MTVKQGLPNHWLLAKLIRHADGQAARLAQRRLGRETEPVAVAQELERLAIGSAGVIPYTKTAPDSVSITTSGLLTDAIMPRRHAAIY
jgi:hypothetical protein